MPIDLSRVNLDNLDPDERAVFMWQYGYHEKFTFYWYLWEAFKTADDNNIGLLGYGFPIERQGLKKYREWDGWWKDVEKKAVLQPKTEEIDAS